MIKSHKSNSLNIDMRSVRAYLQRNMDYGLIDHLVVYNKTNDASHTAICQLQQWIIDLIVLLSIYVYVQFVTRKRFIYWRNWQP